jgi:parallel beta-helix repeat protein
MEGLRVRRGLPSLTVSLLLILDIISNVSSGLIEVDDSGGKDYFTIQEGVDAALPGDTVFVYAGTYYEDVTIIKTINLTGEDRDTTIINSTNLMGIYVTNADFVNISGFTVVNGSWAGIRLMPSNNSLLENNRIEENSKGIQIIESNNTIVRNNIASNNTNDYGIYLDRSTNITVKNNICYGNQGEGIYIFDNSNNNLIISNNCSFNADGIYISSSSIRNYIFGNNLISNLNRGLADFTGSDNVYSNNSIENCYRGFSVVASSESYQVINSTIKNSTLYDIRINGANTKLTTINTTFNKTKVEFGQTTNMLINKWFLHVNVIDYLGNPVPNANVRIDDNLNSSYNQTLKTNINGKIKWLPITEYIEQDFDGDTVGNKTYYTPHKIIAWNDTLVGYAYPEPFMNKSKTVTIVLYNGTLLKLEPGWNLISLPRPQSDTNLQTVLQSIEGHFDSVQWYDATDISDLWKHYYILKPSYLNDLDKINHSMGFWLHITDPEGTTLVVKGNEFTLDQNISLYSGWNLVGYPSKSNKTRDIALDNLFFDTDIDAIWTYNASMQKWVQLDEAGDYFEVGKGYWVHSKVTKVWNVPL